jgi:hypothetical protein
MLIEAYIDFAIMSFLNINAWRIYPNLNFFGSFWDIVSSVGTIVTAFFLGLYPLYGALGIYKNFDHLDDEKVANKFGILYKDQKHKTLHQALFSVYGMVRKLFMVLVFIIFEEYPYF